MGEIVLDDRGGSRRTASEQVGLESSIEQERECLLQAWAEDDLTRVECRSVKAMSRYQSGEVIVEGCQLRGPRPPQNHRRRKAVAGTSSKYTAYSTLSHLISSLLTLLQDN
jgi:hypothetical protein